jgi:hypothetical protein
MDPRAYDVVQEIVLRQIRIEDLNREIDQLRAELDAINREVTSAMIHFEVLRPTEPRRLAAGE